MIKATLIFSLLLFSIIGESRSGDGCFYKHIKDAIELNQTRKNVYIGLSGGLSKKVSKNLINFEKLIIPFSKYFDKKAKKWQEKDIPFLCEDLIDMSEVPEFTYQEKYPMRDKFTPLPIKKWRKHILKLIKKNNIEELKVKLVTYLANLKALENSHCLTRHFLESIARTVFLWPEYISLLDDSKLKQVKKLNKLIKRYLFSQALVLPYALSLDKKAFPVQKLGIPIICQDVPHVPLP